MEKKIADSKIGYLLKYGAVRLSVSQIGAIVQFVVTVVHAVNHSGQPLLEAGLYLVGDGRQGFLIQLGHALNGVSRDADLVMQPSAVVVCLFCCCLKLCE